MVVYIGPPKTGSTSLQAFLAKYASNDTKKAAARKSPAFKDWNYPSFMNNKQGLKFIDTSNKTHIEIREHLLKQDPAKNLVLASEHLIHYDRMLGGKVFDMLSEWTNVEVPEIVLQSRSPRVSHLISNWKQEIHYKDRFTYKMPFHEIMCSEETEGTVTRWLGQHLNPIGVAHDIIFKHELPIHLMDITGVSQQGKDNSHAFACSILKVNCTEGDKWVEGLQGKQLFLNARKGNPEITPEQSAAMEEIFDQRDCIFYDELYDHPLFHLSYRHDGFWPDDCSTIEAIPEYVMDPSSMLHDFREILECPGYESSSIQLRTEANQLISQARQAPIEVRAYLVLAIILFCCCTRRLCRRKKSTVKQK